ncbi:MAG TPA: SDR family oxidoreductase [Acidobacteriota bacterium]|nr:SDR family oxidoreductase [Acidobacteriota bacterium]HRR27218.1 SDR family oxidoreductase [Acidobacteriota bacterium]HRR55619.1 SDR family oxidoreductase [Acidobacteriota bacterium]HRV07660.1 SDR family oxidoreductase [Acidobacteriota bacterium]
MLQEPFSLKGETALITGGGTGLGFGIAQCFVQSGARVVLVGRRPHVLQEAAHRLGDTADWIAHDVCQLDAAGRLADEAERRVGPLTILVNNAGTSVKKPAVETSLEEFESVLRVHVTAAFALTRAVLPRMMERGHGNILFTASMASLFGIPYVVAYSAAKSAYLGLVRTLATEVSSHGVRVNAIAPGWIETPLFGRTVAGDPERSRRILQRTPMGRFGDPEDVGWAAVYLSSPAARFITGTVLTVDGGVSIGF